VCSSDLGLTKESLRDILLKNLESSKVFLEDIAHYHRLPKRSKKCSYKWLHRRIEYYLERKELHKNTRDLSAQLRASVSGGPGAAPATGNVRPPAAAPAADALPATVQNKYCYHHNHAEGGCTRGESCNFSHDWISQTEKDKLVKPISRFANKGGKKGKGGTGKGNSDPPVCRQFLSGNCTREACNFMHFTPALSEEYNRVRNLATGKGKRSGEAP